MEPNHEHKALLKRLPQEIRRKIVAGVALSKDEEVHVLGALTSVNDLTPDLTRELGLQHDLEHVAVDDEHDTREPRA